MRGENAEKVFGEEGEQYEGMGKEMKQCLERAFLKGYNVNLKKR